MSDRHICPWWLAYTFDNPLRRLIHNPLTILGEFVQNGMTVMDIGCGLGYFTLGLAEIVGTEGKVIAVDLQQEMLDTMLKRAAKKGVAHRIIPHRARPTAIGVTTPVDFGLAFWMIHEVPDVKGFFKEVSTILKPSAKLLYAEPAMHVSAEKYNEIIAAAEKTGFTSRYPLAIRFSRANLLENKP
jgi:ubiquinone/menaquinone biosynthesis C-methylase UbiE